jgi:ABC-type sugar transport system, periplasmic component
MKKMKRTKKVLSALLCVLIMTAFVFSAYAIKAVPLKSIKVDKSSITLTVGQTYKLNAKFTPVNTTQKLLSFSTSNKKIATIDSKGKITAVKAGKAVITVISSSNKKITAKCNVTIVEPKKVSLRYFTNSEVDKTEFDTAIPEWNKLHPNISVECIVLSGVDAVEKIRAAIAGGDKIDITIMENEAVSDKADKMYLKLNDLMKKDGFDYLKEFGEYGRKTMFGDNIYGIAKSVAPSAIWINTEILNKLKIALPDENTWTFDDYFSLMKQATIKTDGKTEVYGGVHWQQTFPGILDLATYGGWDVVKADGTPNIDDPVLKEALTKYYKAELVDKVMPTDAELVATKSSPLYELMKGKYATMMGAANSALYFDVYKVAGHLSEETDAKNIFKLLKMPRWSKNSPANRIVPIVVSYSIAKVTKYPEESYQFLKWFCTDCLVTASKVAHRVPTWKNVDQNLLADNWKYYLDSNKNLVQGKDRKDIYLKVLDPTRVAYFPQYRSKYVYASLLIEELKKEFSLVMAGEKNVDDALADAKKECNDIYVKNKQ